jgi:YD repeat-containing protein
MALFWSDPNNLFWTYPTALFWVPPTLITVTFSYDSQGRLQVATYSNGHVITYHYDAAGNRTSVVTT